MVFSTNKRTPPALYVYHGPSLSLSVRRSTAFPSHSMEEHKPSCRLEDTDCPFHSSDAIDLFRQWELSLGCVHQSETMVFFRHTEVTATHFPPRRKSPRLPFSLIKGNASFPPLRKPSLAWSPIKGHCSFFCHLKAIGCLLANQRALLVFFPAVIIIKRAIFGIGQRHRLPFPPMRGHRRRFPPMCGTGAWLLPSNRGRNGPFL